MYTTEDILKHAGVKGMKWGVRKDRKSSGTIKKAAKSVGRYADEVLGSVARERSWVKADLRKMSTKDIHKMANRLQLENDMKKLSKKGYFDKKSYRTRASMSTQELSRKVNRARAQEHFKKNASIAKAIPEQVLKDNIGTVMKIINSVS